jgi:hypothetical protein
MKIPALMTPNSAVTASNMAKILQAQRSRPNGTACHTVKRIRGDAKF